jgi:hypothetical protein
MSNTKPDPLITLALVEPDKDLAQRNLERINQAKRQLGSRWILANRIERKTPHPQKRQA